MSIKSGVIFAAMGLLLPATAMAGTPTVESGGGGDGGLILVLIIGALIIAAATVKGKGPGQ